MYSDRFRAMTSRRKAVRRIAAIAALLLMGVVNAAPTIPLVPGLVIVGASHTEAGDLERVDVIDAVSADGVKTMHRLQHSLKPGEKWLEKERLVLHADLLTSHSLQDAYKSDGPESFPGYTDIGTSAEVLAELKGAGKTVFGYVWVNGTAGFATALDDATEIAEYKGRLKRVGDGAEPFPLLLDGQPVTVQAIHAKGYLEASGGNGYNVEFWFLDDPANPLWLRSTIDAPSNYQVIRIDQPKVTPQLDALEKNCRAPLHGLYFQTASATLLPESATTLKQVAAALKAHTGWIVTIEGHTDNIGGADYNLDLSKRRANAVRDALIQTYGIPASQLVAQGYGLTRPVASNDTLDGRAGNRRVELTRNCASEK